MMTEHEEDALDPELRALLRAEFNAASPAAKDRVASRLSQSVGALALQRPLGARSRGLPKHPLGSALGALRAHPLAFVATFVLGGAFGAAGYAAARRAPPAQIRYVQRPIVPQSPIASARSIPEQSSLSAPALPVRAPNANLSAPSAPSRSGLVSLAEQQALLDLARSAFSRHEYAATLDALRSHFRRYPKSSLGEEREALEIKALAATGRQTEARELARRFKTHFPQSLLLPSLQDSVGVIP